MLEISFGNVLKVGISNSDGTLFDDLALKPAVMKSSRTATEGKLLQDYEKLKNEAKEKMQEAEKTIENIKSEAEGKKSSENLDQTAKTEL